MLSKKYNLRVFSLFLLVLSLAFAAASQAEVQTDAIAVRILPNPNHYSISRWYEEQGFKGSPQVLTVDGYEAVRDGRTVYVNAANIDLSAKKIYTNIYLISYNQAPSAQTVDILGQIVAHWKFNNNLEGLPLGTCSLSSLRCANNKDCPDKYRCQASNNPQVAQNEGKCVLEEAKNCVMDSDCPANLFCSSLKSVVIRDLQRISTLTDLRELLFSYKQANGRYPNLESGTYLKHNTASTWPSWKDFASQIKATALPSDPLNVFGACPGFDAATCWNKDTQRFVSFTNGSLTPPPFSYVFSYSTDANGSNYKLCAARETQADAYTIDQDGLSDINCISNAGLGASGSATNNIPVVNGLQLNGLAGKPFSGSIQVYDQDNNPLTISLNTAGTNWVGWDNNNAPVLKNTNNPNQKIIYSPKAGNAGSYNIAIIVSDNRGASVVKNAVINISNSSIYIEAEDVDYFLDGNNYDKDLEYVFLVDSAIPITNAVILPGQNNPVVSLNFGPTVIQKIGANQYKVTAKIVRPFQPIIQGLNQDYVYGFNIDLNSGAATKDFKINFRIKPPVIDLNCATEARIGDSYYCRVGLWIQDAQPIVYSYSNNLPAGLNWYPAVGAQSRLRSVFSWANLKDLFTFVKTSLASVGGNGGVVQTVNFTRMNDYYSIQGQPSAQTEVRQIEIIARNKYNTESKKTLSLKINNYCGDGDKQLPNTEGAGGFYNDGYEDCDGIDGITSNVTASDINNQYACRNNSDRVYPITTNNFCVFESPYYGGGFCGDGLCETLTIDGQPLEKPENCPLDCGPVSAPIGGSGSEPECGNGILESGEVCDCPDPSAANCNLNGKTCGDFNPTASAPYIGLNLKCVNFGLSSPSTNLADCQGFDVSGCLYPHQIHDNSGWHCESGWYNCDNNWGNGCESYTACCTPSCVGKTCGSNGCGGSCGTCTGDATCINYHCCESSCGSSCCDAGQICCSGTGGNQYCQPHTVPCVY